MTWWVNITPEVVSEVQSFGLSDPASVLESVHHFLANSGRELAADRWDKCRDDYFVYSHIFIDGGHWHSLEFIVNDVEAAVGVLKVAWVTHHRGKPV